MLCERSVHLHGQLQLPSTAKSDEVPANDIPEGTEREHRRAAPTRVVQTGRIPGDVFP